MHSRNPKPEPVGGGHRRLLAAVFLGLAAWGSLLALGALLFGVHPQTGDIRLSVNPLRGLIVLGCVAVFLGGWAALLWVRARRLARPRPRPPGSPHPPRLD